MTRAAAILVLCLSAAAPGQCPPGFAAWPTRQEVEDQMADLAEAHAGAAELVPIGTSAGERSILALRISGVKAAGAPPPGHVVFVGLHHGREWISVQAPLSIARCLLEEAAGDPASDAGQSLASLVVWVIPLLNPDGYAFSREAATDSADQWWRKNRSLIDGAPYGVDLNRNYAYRWGQGFDFMHGSRYAIDETYRGPYPFSERETVALRDLVESLPDVRALVTFHSFGQLVLRPWVYDAAPAPGEAILERLSDDMMARIEMATGADFRDSTSDLAFGEATDYFWARLRLAGLTVELRPSRYDPSTWWPSTGEVDQSNQEQVESARALLRSAAAPRLFLRDHGGDGAVEPSAQWGDDGWSNPFWESPDVTFDEVNAKVCVRVRNASAADLAGCVVTAYAMSPGNALEIPPRPGVATVLGTATLDLAAGADALECFGWPAGGLQASGLDAAVIGALVTHPDDRPLTTLIERSSNVACRSVAALDLAPGTHTLPLRVVNPLAADAAVQVRWSGLPAGWSLEPAAPPGQPAGAALLAGVTDPVIAAEGELAQDLLLVIPGSAAPGTAHAIQVHYGLLPLTGSTRVAGGGRTFLVRVAGSP